MNKKYIGIGLLVIALFAFSVTKTYAFSFSDFFHMIFGGGKVEHTNLGAAALIPATSSTTSPAKTTVMTKTTAPAVTTKSTVTVAPVAAASITLLSPKGGEVYKAGQTITVTWNTSNIPSTNNHVAIVLAGYKNGLPISVLPLITGTANDGKESVTLPLTLPKVAGATFGNNFKIFIGIKDSSTTVLASTSSANFFTITSPSFNSSLSASLSAANLTASAMPCCGTNKSSVQQWIDESDDYNYDGPGPTVYHLSDVMTTAKGINFASGLFW